jgi:hypothetical protein
MITEIQSNQTFKIMKKSLKYLFEIAFVVLTSATAMAQFNTKLPINKNPNVGATALETKINLENMEETLCPSKLERGDREFGGNGPKVKCEVKIRLANNGTEIWADISFWAQETKPDNSTTTGQWSKKVYDAPYGKKITKIVSDQASRTVFVSPAAGSQIFVPGSDMNAAMNAIFEGITIPNEVRIAHGVPALQEAYKLIGNYNKGNTVIVMPATEGTLVKFFHIVGDTGGDDISNDDNCNDDTRIEKIEFFPVRVIMGDR